MGSTYNVYIISSDQTDKIYVGMTDQTIDDRMSYHMRALRYQRHTNHEFQAVFNAHPAGWSISLAATHSDKQKALDHEGVLIEANPLTAMNVYKNPTKVHLRSQRVSEALALDILRCKGEGYTYEIAEQFGVSQPVVSHIWRGNHWTSRFAMDDLKYEFALLVADFYAGKLTPKPMDL